MTPSARGFATLEIMLALAVICSVLGAVIIISFGNQSLLSDTSTNQEARGLAEKMLHDLTQTVHTDFTLLRPTANTLNGEFTQSLALSDADFMTQRALSSVSWFASTRTQHTDFDQLVTDFEHADQSGTCDPYISGDWTHPHIVNTVTDFAELLGDPTGTYSVSDVDAYYGKLYVTANNTTNKTDPTFFVFDVNDPLHPTLLKKIDNLNTSKIGPNAVSISKNSLGMFAYIVGASSFSKGQLQIIDLTATPLKIVSTYKIPLTVVPSAGDGASVFYEHGFLYVGLTATTGGDEFGVIDVHDPQNPQWIGGFGIGHDVNALFAKNGYVYIAHPANNPDLVPEEITIMDVSHPDTPLRVNGYNAPDNQGHGESLSVVGTTLYLGRTVTNTNPELDILDISKPAQTPTLLGVQEIGSSVNALVARDFLTFLITTNGKFEIWNTGVPAHVSSFAPDTALPAGSSGTTMDCEKNTFFVGSNDANGRGYLSIITSS